MLDHADAPGFATNELHLLSQLVLGHRGKLRKLETALDDEGFVTQVLALRLAVILCHARRDPDPLALNVARNGRAFVLRCRSRWIDAYPQSAHLLREETLAWQKTGWRVEFEVS